MYLSKITKYVYQYLIAHLNVFFYRIDASDGLYWLEATMTLPAF